LTSLFLGILGKCQRPLIDKRLGIEYGESKQGGAKPNMNSWRSMEKELLKKYKKIQDKERDDGTFEDVR